jgi:alpha-D-ribose 1-methylphosphonate 5-triphosphate synthase subunit PhnL
MFMGCPISAAFFSAAAITRRASAKLTIVSPCSLNLMCGNCVCLIGLSNYTSGISTALHDLMNCTACSRDASSVTVKVAGMKTKALTGGLPMSAGW